MTNILTTSQVGENAVRILQDAAEREGNKYSRKTAINYKLSLTKEEFIESIEFMHEDNVLRGSSWNMKNGERGDKLISKG